MKRKKCIVIGSGLGGLSSALILQRNGFDVLVLEQSGQYGGCMQCFTRKGTKFETGMHYIGSADKNQILYTLLRYLKIEDLPLKRLDEDGYDYVSINGDTFKFANGRANFIDSLASKFPHSRDELSKYYNIIQSVVESSSIRQITDTKLSRISSVNYQMCCVNEVISSVITDPLLQNVLVGNQPLYAGEYGKTPFSTHAFIADFYNKSAFRIIGGSDIIVTKLVDSLLAEGGRIKPNTKVTGICYDQKYCTGVKASDGLFYEADCIVSAIHPTRTMELLDNCPLFRPSFKNRMLNLPNSIGAFSVYVEFKKEAIRYMNHNFFGYECQDVWKCTDYKPDQWPLGYLYMHLCSDDNQKWAESGVVISYMKYDDVKKWAGTTVGKRGSDYLKFKKEHAEKLLDTVSKNFPNLKESISKYYTSTPLTYNDYTGTINGSMYGIARDVNRILDCHVPARTRIPNLFFAGQNINSHGILGVLVGTINLCCEILYPEMIYQQIQEANKK